VDAAYMNKVELETKVDSLNDEINFLKTLNETVRTSEWVTCYLLHILTRKPSGSASCLWASLGVF
jgi:hypothetical protein